MTRLTKQQRQVVVQDFASGVDICDLAFVWGVSALLIESILRQAMKGTHATVKINTQGAAVIPPILIYHEEV